MTAVLAMDIIITVLLRLPVLLLLAMDVIITVFMAKVILTVILVSTMSMVGVAAMVVIHHTAAIVPTLITKAT